jgi:hypothetical protein
MGIFTKKIAASDRLGPMLDSLDVAPGVEPWRQVRHGLTNERYGPKEAAILIHAACLLQRLG